MTKTYGVMLKPEMIRAYVKGQKTQTRRLMGLDYINQEPGKWELIFTPVDANFFSFGRKETYEVVHVRMPYGNKDCTLYFKETYRMWRGADGLDFILYKADNAKVNPTWWSQEDWSKINSEWFDKWRSSMFMPQRFARFRDLPILSVKIHRLWDITEEDAYAEGVESDPLNDCRLAYFRLWDTINGKTLPASENPWGVRVRISKLETIRSNHDKT